MTVAVRHSELHPAAAAGRGLRLFISLVAGVASQRAANQPDASDRVAPGGR